MFKGTINVLKYFFLTLLWKLIWELILIWELWITAILYLSRIPVPECLGTAYSTPIGQADGERLTATEDVIVMQNLKAGQQLAERKWFQLPLEVGLNEESLHFVFKSLAKIHAVPLAMRAKARAASVAEVIPGWKEAQFGPDVLAKHLSDGQSTLGSPTFSIQFVASNHYMACGNPIWATPTAESVS